MAVKSQTSEYDLNDILDKILETKSYSEIATEINIAIGTVKRWKELNNVPKSYTFEFKKSYKNVSLSIDDSTCAKGLSLYKKLAEFRLQK